MTDLEDCLNAVSFEMYLYVLQKELLEYELSQRSFSSAM